MTLEQRSANKPFLNRRDRAIGAHGGTRPVSVVSRDYIRSVIFTLNKEAQLWNGGLLTALDKVLESTLVTLGCEVASVWHLNPAGNELVCIAQRETGIGLVEPAGVVIGAETPDYFNAVLNDRVNAVQSCDRDPRTARLVDTYFKPHNIRSMLTASIIRDGSPVGIVQLEQLDQERQWSIVEQECAIAMADLLAQVLMVSELRRRNELLTIANSLAPVLGQNHTADQLSAVTMQKLEACFPDLWAGFFRVYGSGSYARLTARSGESMPEVLRSVMFEVNIKDPFFTSQLASGEAAVMEDCDAHLHEMPASLAHLVVALNIRSMITVPLLRAEDEPLGFIQIWARERVAYPEVDIGGLSSIAANFSAAYANTIDREQLRVRAFQDQQTGLYNREQLNSDLRDLDESKAHELILLEIRDFKEIDQKLGREFADEVVATIGSRVHKFTQQDRDGRGYRLNGVQFGLLFSEARMEQGLSVTLQKLLAEPVNIDGVCLNMTPVIGVATLSRGSSRRSELFQRADVALGWAQGVDTNLAHYNPGRHVLGPGNRELLDDLSSAIDSNTLMLCYQPAFDLATGRLVSCEALTRWRHERHSFIKPDRFVTLAEHGEMIKPLTSWVARNVISQISIFQMLGVRVPVAINISAMDLVDTDLPRELRALLEKHQVAPEYLRLEVTEASLMRDVGVSGQVIDELMAMGLKLDINRFGRGYSSFANLSHLPLHSIKIDRSFQVDLANDALNQASISSIVGMAKGLGLQVVAEGIEDEGTLKLVRDLGCAAGQGFYFSKPIAAADFISRSRSWV